MPNKLQEAIKKFTETDWSEKSIEKTQVSEEEELNLVRQWCKLDSDSLLKSLALELQSPWPVEQKLTDSVIYPSIPIEQLYDFDINRNPITGEFRNLSIVPKPLAQIPKDSSEEPIAFEDISRAPGLPEGLENNAKDFDTTQWPSFLVDEFGQVCSEAEAEKTKIPVNADFKVLDLSKASLNDQSSDKYIGKEINSEFLAATSTFRPKNETSDDFTQTLSTEDTFEEFKDLVPELAMDFNFELDTFQKQAIHRLEQNESVFVTAHTSAGKTVIAEYAIALAAKHMTKAIYTSPIKALSNQKFHDFKKKFEDVGIITGDIQINPKAGCLIMTTEILRSMLYRESDTIRDVEFVIFDEVHYVNDAQRGVVWEEVIIMLPEHITICLLSATVPNAREFASWVGRTKRKNIYVISTSKRPVPLEYYLWASDSSHLIVDSNKNFLLQGYKSAKLALEDAKSSNSRNVGQQKPKVGPKGLKEQPVKKPTIVRQKQRDTLVASNIRNSSGNTVGSQRRFTSSWSQLTNYLEKAQLLPCVAFVFSRKRCVEYAESLSSKNLCSKTEKNEIHVFVERALLRLRKEDRTLPQITQIKFWLSFGVGVHHGGLLPIVKELVEMLFSRGLVKILFATETFAMGVNMPAKCVVFSSIRKHDGRNLRDLLPGECTQMAGRAGRRGLDKTGTVIIRCDSELPDTAILHNMLLGQPTKLTSQFRLTYHMILCLLRVEMLRVEDMMKKSFSENMNQRLMPSHQASIAKLEEKINELKSSDGLFTELLTKQTILSRWLETVRDLMDYAATSKSARKIFCSGRVVFYKGHGSRKLAVVLNLNASGYHRSKSTLECIVFEPKSNTFEPYKDANDYLPFFGIYKLYSIRDYTHSMNYKLETISVSDVVYVTDQVLKISSRAIRNFSDAELDECLGSVKNFTNVNDDWSKEFNWHTVKDLDFYNLAVEKQDLEQNLLFDPKNELDNFESIFLRVQQISDLENIANRLRQAISVESLELLPSYHQRVNVLQEMAFIDSKHNVLLKGRVSCEVRCAHELILTELLFENAFAEFEPEELVSLLSAFIFDEKSEVEPELTAHLETGIKIVRDIAARVHDIQEKHQVSDIREEEDFSGENRYKLMRVVYEWARGMSFKKIMDLTDVSEGSIVRTIIRLDELLREALDGLRLIGNIELTSKIRKSRELIRRDVVWAPSLYM